VAGCGAPSSGDDGIASQEGNLGESALDDEGVLLLVDDRAVSEATFVDRTKLSADVAHEIVLFRTGADGKPRWFSSMDEIHALPNTEPSTFERLAADARANGYTEKPGFDVPALRLSVPDNLGHPPTSADVVVEAGFDGKTPDEVVAIVRGRITNVVDPSNERFVEATIRDNHKAFTLAVNNMFAPGSPHAAFASALGATSLTMLGTMSSVTPTILRAETNGTTTYYARGGSGRYEALATPPKYPVIMRAKLSLGGPGGVRVFYPAWSAKVLAGPTASIVESG